MNQIKLPDGDRSSERSESTVHSELIAELLTPGWCLDGLGLLDMEDSMVVHRTEQRGGKNELLITFSESHSSGVARLSRHYREGVH